MDYTYYPRGVCSTQINFTIEDGKVKNVKYHGGCNGNLQAVSRLVEGQPVEEVIEKLAGIKCGFKATSCADQLTQALVQAMKKEKEQA